MGEETEVVAGEEVVVGEEEGVAELLGAVWKEGKRKNMRPRLG